MGRGDDGQLGDPLQGGPAGGPYPNYPIYLFGLAAPFSDAHMLGAQVGFAEGGEAPATVMQGPPGGKSGVPDTPVHVYG